MKRAAEEVSTTVVEEQLEFGGQNQAQPVLKLKRPKVFLSPARTLVNELNEFTSTQDTLRLLLDLERALPLEESDENELVLRTLWESIPDCKDVSVKAKIISLLTELARHPGVNTLSVIEEMINILSKESK